MGQFSIAANADVEPSLLSWIKTAAAQSPFDVRLQSGYRPGDPRFHGKHQAIDVQLIDPKTRQVVPNYQTPASFAAYQGFANQVHDVAGSDPRLRWGGYFSGGKGKYGALDLMHFDLGGDTVGMAGGSWDAGLTPQQSAIWGLSPGGGSTGSGNLAPVFDGSVGVGPPPPDTGLDMIAGGLGDLSGSTQKRQAAASKQAAQGPVETQRAISGIAAPEPTPTAPAATPVAPAAVLDEAGLAELFKVADIGKAGATPAPPRAGNPYAPPRKWF